MTNDRTKQKWFDEEYHASSIDLLVFCLRFLAKNPASEVLSGAAKLDPKFNMDRLMVVLNARAEVWSDFYKVLSARRSKLKNAKDVFDLLKQHLKSCGVEPAVFKKRRPRTVNGVRRRR